MWSVTNKPIGLAVAPRNATTITCQGRVRWLKQNRAYRTSFVLPVGCFLFFTLFPLQTMAGEPTEQIKATINGVISILNDKELKKPGREPERRARIRAAIEKRFDFVEMAKRSLGIHWNKRTPDEQNEFVSLFSDLLEDTYIRKIESYEDEKVSYVGESQEGSYARVETRIERATGAEMPVEYMIFQRGDKWEVYDVIIEGVSLVLNYRSQFNKIILSTSYGDLVERLRKKAVTRS
jgi:phospholipid transport system substrate-binding protein